MKGKKLGSLLKTSSKRDATNTNRVVSSDVIESLPLRSVDDIVGLQAGVVDNHVRGGRSGDNAYYVDGVLMKDHWEGSNTTGGLSQVGMEEISFKLVAMVQSMVGLTVVL